MEASVKIPKGCLVDQTTHASGRSAGNGLRTSLLSLKNLFGWFNHILKEGKNFLNEIGRLLFGK